MGTSTSRRLGALVRSGGPLDPVLKWPGGKRRERPGLLATWPATASRYLELFVGGGAMWLATDPTVPAAVNDASEDLMAVYRAATDVDPRVFERLDDFARWWSALDGFGEAVQLLARLHPAEGDVSAEVAVVLDGIEPRLRAVAPPELASGFVAEVRRIVPAKLARMAKVQSDRGVVLPDDDVLANVEGAIRAGAYTTVRGAYNAERGLRRNSGLRVACFVVLRELAYASMFRFNADGEFNVPYGGVTYNRKDLGAVAAALRAPAFLDRLATTDLHVGDFGRFVERVGPEAGDFVFLDPPYLSDFRDYDGRGFGPADHRRLAGLLRELPCRFQLVIKATDEVRDWYGHGDWSAREVDKTYNWTIKSRNDRRATHLVIENT